MQLPEIPKRLNPLIKWLDRWSQYLLPLGFLFLALAVGLADFDTVEIFRNRVFDTYQRIKPRTYEKVPVRVIDLDDESLAKLGQWPWPRTLVAEMVTRLANHGASTIVFDIVFAEPDRTSPKAILKLLPTSKDWKAVRKKFGALPGNDEVLAQVFAQTNVVTGFVLTGRANDVRARSKAGFSYTGDNPLSYLPDFPGAVVNLPMLVDSASGNGAFSRLSELDGVVRRAPLLFRQGKTILPSLSIEALRVAQGASNFTVRCSGGGGAESFGEHLGISAIKVGDLVIPTDSRGRFWVYFSHMTRERTIPAWKIFEDDFPSERLAGTIAFIGTSAAGLKDLRNTPLNPVLPGVEVHAQTTEQILLGNFLQRPDWAQGAEFLFMLFLGLALIIFLPRLGAAWCFVLAVGMVGGSIALSWHAFTEWKMLIEPIYSSIVVVTVYIVSTLVGYLKSEREKRQTRAQFSQYMSPHLVEQLASNPDQLKLGGEMKEMTFLFTDIRGFTTISEQFEPEDLTDFINKFLTPMTSIILDNHGTIDKYMGDCIMAFWNAPLDDKEHSRNACKAAVAMRGRLASLNEELKAQAEREGRKFHEIKVGIGINSGKCCVGNMGSDQRFDYSVLGDNVNLASRLEGQSKTYGVDIVLGENTKSRTPGYAFLELDLIRVKGKKEPVRIFALLGGREVRESDKFKKLAVKHGEMLKAYRSQEWGRSQALIKECREIHPSLPLLYGMYAERIEVFAAAPPRKDWDGIFTATAK